MRLLRPLCFPCVNRWALWKVVLTKTCRNDLSGSRLRRSGDVRRVGSHVGNETLAPEFAELNPLIQLLGDLHGAADAVAEFARCLLLQGAGREWSRRPALNFL